MDIETMAPEGQDQNPILELLAWAKDLPLEQVCLFPHSEAYPELRSPAIILFGEAHLREEVADIFNVPFQRLGQRLVWCMSSYIRQRLTELSTRHVMSLAPKTAQVLADVERTAQLLSGGRAVRGGVHKALLELQQVPADRLTQLQAQLREAEDALLVMTDLHEAEQRQRYRYGGALACLLAQARITPDLPAGFVQLIEAFIRQAEG